MPSTAMMSQILRSMKIPLPSIKEQLKAVSVLKRLADEDPFIGGTVGSGALLMHIQRAIHSKVVEGLTQTTLGDVMSN